MFVDFILVALLGQDLSTTLELFEENNNAAKTISLSQAKVVCPINNEE